MKKNFSLKTVIALMLTASALTCTLTVALVAVRLGFGTDLYGEIRTYIALRHDIQEEFIGDYDSGAVSDAALTAAVDALDDRWSFYMTPEAYADYLAASNNQYSGLGVSVSKDEATGGLIVQDVFAGSSAETAGVLIGDIITAIDDTTLTADMTLTDATALIDREVGQTVRLTLLGADGAEREVEATYAVIETNPVSYEMLDGNIGYVFIENFEAGAAEGFLDAVDTLVNDGATSFIYDVRNNRGGRVSELKKILDRLLPECEIFVAVEKNGQEDISYSDETALELPAVVLVNGYSFSAAEYFAAVLQEYDYASVVGQNTTGKSRSQITLTLPDGGALHISSGEYLTPNRVSLTEQGGIRPDIKIEMSDEDTASLYAGLLDRADDHQLQKAIELMKNDAD